MKKLLFPLILAAAFVQGCGAIPGTSRETIEPGYAGLKIKQYGENRGIENAELVTGRVWYNGYTTDIIEYPTFVTTYPFTKDVTEGSPTDQSVNFSVSGSPVSADVGVSFGYSTESIPASEITDKNVSEERKDSYTKLHKYYKKFRKEPDLFLTTNIRNGLRDCFSISAETLELSPTDLPTNQQKLTSEVQTCLQGKFPEVVITEVSLLSSFRLDPEIQKRINDQFAAQQAAKTAEFNKKKEEAEAEAIKAKAIGEANAEIERARGQAEADRLRKSQVTPELIRLKELEIELERVREWDGREAPTIQTPNVQLGGSSN